LITEFFLHIRTFFSAEGFVSVITFSFGLFFPFLSLFLFKRKKIWYVQYDEPSGKKKRVSTNCKLKTDALKFLSNFKRSLNPKAPDLKISEFRDKFIEFIEPQISKSYLRQIIFAFRELINFAGDVCLHKISVYSVDIFLSSKFKTARHSALGHLKSLKSAFSKAVSWNFIEANPFEKIKLGKIARKHPVFISESELQMILDCIQDKLLKAIVIVGYFCGLRLDEILHLTFESIDLSNRIIHVKNTEYFKTKNRRDRTVPMCENVYRTFLELKQNRKVFFVDRPNFIFQKSNGFGVYHTSYVSHLFKKAVRQAGLSENVCFKSLRSSFGSYLVQSNVSIFQVQRLLGHSSPVVTQNHYAHLDVQSLAEAIKVFDMNNKVSSLKGS